MRARGAALAALVVPTLCAVCAALAARAQEPDASGGHATTVLDRPLFGGRLERRRHRLAQRGLDLELYYTLDVIGNVSGGVRRRARVLGDVDLILNAELEPLVGWKGARASLYGLGTHGGSVSADVGDVQGVDEIEAFPTWKLFEAWLEQELWKDALSLRGGLYDVNSEFDVVPVSGLFLNASQGIGAAFGLSGRNGPSIFPTTSLAARVQARPASNWVLRFVVADGVPGDPDDPAGTHIHLGGGDGLLLAAEVSWIERPSLEPPGRPQRRARDLSPEREYGSFGKLALGGWGYTSEFVDLASVATAAAPGTRRGSWGAYALVQQSLYHERDDPFQGLVGYARVGVADPRVNAVALYVGGGLVYRGAIPGRDRDRLGLAVAAARFGDEFRRAAERGGSPIEPWEVDVELTYRVQVTDWLQVQPDLQVVVDPGGNPALADAVVVGCRFEISL